MPRTGQRARAKPQLQRRRSRRAPGFALLTCSVRRPAARLQANARIETALGLGAIAIVSVLGTLPPGLHAEPGWPFPFRLDIAALTPRSQILLAILALIICLCAVATVATAAAGQYRRTGAFAVVLALCLALGWVPLRPAIEPAYPTSYYAPSEL